MTPREAFRHLSHRFHGKMPGKKKTEKRIQKYALSTSAGCV
jgi:U4/U6.U5 tri-snRNP-associated protein 1